MIPSIVSHRWETQGRSRVAPLLVLAVVLLGTLLRFYGLGSRSLWADEFCTWHVSRLPLAESLRWGPELTKPPLYQFCLRALTDDPRPPEWLLRLPAAVAGAFTILAAFALGRVGGGSSVGCSMAGLAACSLLQIEYSQEARPYSMLALGTTLSLLFWFQLVSAPTWRRLGLYVLATALALYAHYLTALTVLAEVIWWSIVSARRIPSPTRWRPVAAVAAVGVLCVPLVVRYLWFRSSLFQGLAWIPPATWNEAITVLGRVTFGRVWVFLVLAPTAAWWVAGSLRTALRPGGWREPRFGPGVMDPCGLAFTSVGIGWFGLLLASWWVHPAMVARYALPTAVPALLLPLIVAHRLHPRLPVWLLLIFGALGLRNWATQRMEADPGFRELSAYLVQTVDPTREAVVLTIDRRTHPEWDDAERLSFQYYPPGDLPVHELHLAADSVTATNDMLKDPRGLWLVVLWCDPLEILSAAGRQPALIPHDGFWFTQLLFSPYRLVRVSPIDR